MPAAEAFDHAAGSLGDAINERDAPCRFLLENGGGKVLVVGPELFPGGRPPDVI